MAWTVDVPVKLSDVRTETPELHTLTLVTGDPEAPSSATILLGVRDADGAWHTVADIDVLRLTDEPAPPVPPAAPPAEEGDPPGEPPGQAKKEGAAMVDAVLTAKIDGNTELAQRFGIANGTPLSEALPQIVWGFLYPETVAAEPSGRRQRGR